MDLGIQKKQLAKHLGVDETTIHNWEDRAIAPAIRLMPGILDFLGYNPSDDNASESLAETLMAHRTKLGLSQKRLAVLVGIDPSTLAGWEREDHRPTKRSLDLIERFLKRKYLDVKNFEV